MVIEEKLNRKVTVLFSKTTDKKWNEICQRMNRPKSNLIRLITMEWIEKVMKGQKPLIYKLICGLYNQLYVVGGV
jgi:hypothetical protein